MCEDQKDTTFQLTEKMFDNMDGGNSFLLYSIKKHIDENRISSVGSAIDVTIAAIASNNQTVDDVIADTEYAIKQLSIFLRDLKFANNKLL